MHTQSDVRSTCDSLWGGGLRSMTGVTGLDLTSRVEPRVLMPMESAGGEVGALGRTLCCTRVPLYPYGRRPEKNRVRLAVRGARPRNWIESRGLTRESVRGLGGYVAAADRVLVEVRASARLRGGCGPQLQNRSVRRRGADG